MILDSRLTSKPMRSTHDSTNSIHVFDIFSFDKNC